MCGLAALVDPRGAMPGRDIVAMCDAIRHRGPDDEGYAVFTESTSRAFGGPDTPDDCYGAAHPYAPAAGETGAGGPGRVALGHRRLSILDLSPGGHQPLCDETRRMWITYNGEIYNFEELRAELAALGHRFTTRSDTEVLLAAYAAWGAACLDRLNGMFAFVLYDRKADRLFAARDRFGVKPLYWWRSPTGVMAFASEIKQFTVMPEWRARLNGQQAYDFLAWGLTDHNDQTLFSDVFQLAPGHCLTLDLTDQASRPVARRWYQLVDAAPLTPYSAAVDRFRDLFQGSIRARLRADVPVGTALSGGVDSSSIVCTVDRLLDGMADTQPGGRRFNTFSARAHDAAFDEGPFIEAVVGQTDVTPHCAYPDADGLFDALDAMVWHHDEPFGSTSVFAEWSVFRLAQQAGIKVTLDGHGADEILAGYTSFLGPQLGGLVRRGCLASLAQEFRAQRRLHGRSARELLALLAGDLLPPRLRDGLRRLTGRPHGQPAWLDLGRLGARPADPYAAAGAVGRGVTGLARAQLTATSLPMQLRWADRDSMAHSVESREPYLDPALVAFTMGQPDEHKVDRGVTKRLLRDAMRNILPTRVGQRRDKMGFVTPEEIWVRRDRPADFRRLLDQAVASCGGILTSGALRDGAAIIDGSAPFSTRLWRMICFGRWMDRFGVGAPA